MIELEGLRARRDSSAVLADVEIQQHRERSFSACRGRSKFTNGRRIVRNATESYVRKISDKHQKAVDVRSDWLIREQNIVRPRHRGHLCFGNRRAFEFRDALRQLHPTPFRPFVCFGVRT